MKGTRVWWSVLAVLFLAGMTVSATGCGVDSGASTGKSYTVPGSNYTTGGGTGGTTGTGTGTGGG